MAFFQINYYSQILRINTNINVFIPTPDSEEALENRRTAFFQDGAKYQVMYLLHGTYGDYSDWMRLTSVERYAQSHKMALVMPSAENSFYHNMVKGADYFDYLTVELPAFITNYFPISRKRENTFIAGLSMGGYGALKIAFEKPENYAACASLSGVLDIQEFKDGIQKYMSEDPYFWDSIFDNPNRINESDSNLFRLLEKRKEEKRQIPRVYQTVGTEDTTTYEINQEARRRFEQAGIDFTYEEKSGIHDWKFWDSEIEKVLEWIQPANHSVEK